MVLSRKNFPLQKCRGGGNLLKKRRFSCQHQKNSSGCQSDNFDPRRSAYGPYESLCPKFSETHAGKVSIFKIVGARPLRSQVIPICVTQNSCFFGIFWAKMLSHGQTVHFWPHSVIHIRKAEHLTIQKIRLKFDFRHHVNRQIFGDALQLTWRVDLNLHLKYFRPELSWVECWVLSWAELSWVGR